MAPMALTSGTYALGPASGTLRLRTGRSGLGRRAGHDLTIEVTRWSGEAVIDLDDPSACTVTAEMDPASFEVVEGGGGVMALTAADRIEILKTVREKILKTRAHPVIRFRSTEVSGTPSAFTIEGELTIMDVTRPVTVHGRISGERLTGEATVVQTRWGIKPYSALFGQLRLADEVKIEFDSEPTG
ncbi:polyisoprenoid-binding protein [Actinoallomurus iriomotensis]|uniref:Polyisoprenoid-binding protein n=2 Tax=Actinoallomurus iriomotensis TaxID=478107 RepID=A0A9W6RYE7_9ACTN|nr:polyisoprenoid-binding protein [Actinoallomurus iriomotensis]